VKVISVKTHDFEFHADALPGHVNPDDEADRLPINYTQLALRYKWLLLAGLLCGAVLGHLAYLKAGPEYEAVAQILVSRKYTPPVRESERMMQETGKPSEHIPLIVSPMIAERAITIGKLKELPTFRGSTDVVEDILDGLKVKRTAGQDRSHFSVLEIRYASRIPADAKKVVESVIAAYDQYLVEQSREHSSEVLALAQKTTVDLQVKIQQKQDEYHEFLQTVPEEFRSALGQSNTATLSTNVAPEDVIRTLGEERNRNQIRLTELTSRRRSIEDALAAGEPRETIEHEVRRFMALDGRANSESRATEISIYQSQLLPLLLRERELARTFGKDYPDLVTVRDSIQKTVETFRKLGIDLPEGVDAPALRATGNLDYIAMYLDSLRRQCHELQLKEKELDDLIRQEGLRARDFAEYRASDQSLRAELTQLQLLWQKRLDREGEVAIEKDTTGYTLKTLAPVKDALVLKRLIKFYAGGSVFCALLVAVACLLRELKDLTVKDARDVRTTLRTPVLGSVVAFEAPADIDRTRVHPALRYLLAPHSIEAENFRAIRTSLLVTLEQHEARLVLFSSPEPGDGKTTLVSNLAMALAQVGKRVLLVDADMRRPRVHELFRVSPDIGLADVLAGELDALNAVRETSLPGLSLMTAGHLPDSPAELLSTPRLATALRELRDEYDIVLLDAPPLLAVSDPCILARHVDGMILVTRLNKNARSAVIRARELIRDHGIRLLGAVANGTPVAPNRGYAEYGEYLGKDRSRPAQPERELAQVGS